MYWKGGKSSLYFDVIDQNFNFSTLELLDRTTTFNIMNRTRHFILAISILSLWQNEELIRFV